jgi:hypothetical protein
VPDEGVRIDPKVENGVVYDRASLDNRDSKKIVLPENTTVLRSGEPGKIQLYMAKTLSFGGHPSEPMTLNRLRKEMGCAVQEAEGAILISTYGEWDSHKEGGTQMKLVVNLPDQILTEQRKGLSGSALKFGWTPIPSVPDPDRVASK